jgi:hypothetical protein
MRTEAEKEATKLAKRNQLIDAVVRRFSETAHWRALEKASDAAVKAFDNGATLRDALQVVQDELAVAS